MVRRLYWKFSTESVKWKKFYRVTLCKRGTCICCLHVSVYPSVCLSVTRPYYTKTAKRKITKTMPYDSQGTLVFWCQRSRRNSNWMILNGGAKWRRGRLQQRISTNISLYLRNGARLGHSYCGTLMETRMCYIDWCYFQWPWVTLITPIHPIFDILYRLSYLRSEWR